MWNETPARASRVLVVDDERVIRALLREVLEPAGHQVEAVASGAGGLGRLEQARFDLLILDKNLEDMSGLDVLRRARTLDSGMEVVMFRQARRRDLLFRRIPDDVYRWGVSQSLSPVVFFLLSVPVAFVSTGLAVACWFGAIPFQIVTRRWRPENAERYLGH